MTTAEPWIYVRCTDCGAKGQTERRFERGWLCPKCRPARTNPEPDARNVDWPRLVAVCEARGVPVSRVDELGNAHLIRTTAQLREEWE